MQADAIIARLAANADVFRALVHDVGPDQARWRPAPDQWSILEVVNHLADEEVEDFRTRLDLTLHRPDEAWPPIDPVAWAVERGYRERDLAESIERFVRRRAASIAWLEALEAPAWDRTSVHPRGQRMSAGDLLTSWLAHDLIHVRQINRLHRQYLVRELSEHDPAYAGAW